MLRFIMPLLVMVLCLGCDEKASPGAAQPTSKPAAQVDSKRLARLDALGDGGLLVGVLDGRDWAKVHHRLTPVFAKLPRAAPAEFASVADLPGLLNVLYKGLLGAKDPLDLSALDANGAVLVSLFEPATFGPPGAVTAHIGFERGMVPLRHEIVLPATNASALAASVLTGLKVACDPAPHGCDFGALQVGVKADGDVVRIAALMPASVEDAGTMLWTTAQPASVRTPAYIQLATPGAGLALLVRPWRIRAMHNQQSTNDIAMALGHAPPDVHQMMFAEGLSIVLNGVRFMHAERPDLEDAVVRLVADDAGIAFEGTHALTATGAKAIDAALSTGGRTLAIKVPVIAQINQRVDLNTLLDGVGPRPLFAKMKRLRDVTTGFEECGYGCALHALARVPFSTARGVLDLAPPQVKAIVRALPTAMQAVLVRLDPGFKPVAALAGDVAKDFDTGQLRAFRGTEVHLIPKGDRALLLVGIGVDPRTVFDLQATSTATSTTATTAGTARIEPAALNQVAQLLGAAPLIPLFDALGPIVADSALAPGGHAFAWRLHLSTSPGVTPSPFAPAATSPFTQPILGFTPSAGDRCLREVAIGMSMAFSALANVAPAERSALFVKAFAEGASSLKCAQSHASTKPAALGMRRLFVHVIGIGALPGQTEMLAFIEAQCAATKDAWICGEAERIKDLPPPPPPNPLAAPASGPGVDPALLDLIKDQPGDLAFKLTPADLELRNKPLIQMVIRSKSKQAKYCYEKSLFKNPALAGKATVSFTIQPDGSVAEATSVGPKLPPEVHACLLRVVQPLRFVPAVEPTRVNYPFVFKSN
ncbi:MAG: hypothetical protein ACI9U2_000805 [Bradymonadia bacterium]|jgi:hypothetical protein